MIKNLMFDFDGTIVDTSEGIVKSMQYAFAKCGHREVEENLVRDIIGPPLAEMIKVLLKSENEAEIEECVKAFRERYGSKGVFEMEPYSGIIDVIKNLAGQGFKLYIVTSKPTEYVNLILKDYDLEELFIDVTGVNLTGKSLSKSERLSWLINKHNLSADDSVMIGDRPEDLIAANNNGLRSIAVTYGFGKKEELIDNNATYIVNSVQSLEKAIINLYR